MKILALVTDAFGGLGGIAKFNRDFLRSLCAHPDVSEVVALPRLMPEAPESLPQKLTYLTRGVGGKLRYALSTLRCAITHSRSTIIICGHINLLPLAFLTRSLCRPLPSGRRPPIVLVIHGIDAWQPTRSAMTNRLIRKVDAVVAVSEFTRKKFWSWARPERARGFILPNSVDLALFTPGPKNPSLLDRYGLWDKKVLLTVARLSGQERYKGIDETLQVLPNLAKQIPNLCYLVVGGGDDRTRLFTKAQSLGLNVAEIQNPLSNDFRNRSSDFGPPPSAAPRVIFTGHVPEAEKVDHYRLADAFVMPGRGEGFGIAYLEALACGLPVVASQLDASVELAARCERVIPVNPDAPGDVSAGILRALALGRGQSPAGLAFYSRESFAQRSGAIVTAIASARNILVFRIGQLGDTIVALPAMWAVRKHFPNARFTLLCDRHPDKARVLAADLLRGAGIFDASESYAVDDSAAGRALRPWRMLKLLRRLRALRFDTLVYLAPTTRTAQQVARDRRFFAAAGIKEFVGLRASQELPEKVPGQPLPATDSEANLLLARFAADGVALPSPGKGSFELKLGQEEAAEVDSWLASQRSDGQRRWLGIGPGSKMPAKRWAEDRFETVVAALIREFDVWPVVLGGSEDSAMADRLIGAWGRGYNAAGVLTLRGAAAALKRCTLYVGNDTGTMHLAAAVGTSCVAIFSARERRGTWYPSGNAHQVLRSQIECEDCRLMECVERQNECLRRIEPDAVIAACRSVIAASTHLRFAPVTVE